MTSPQPTPQPPPSLPASGQGGFGEMPEHWLLPVNAAGDGPAEPYETVAWACSCADGADCIVTPPTAGL